MNARSGLWLAAGFAVVACSSGPDDTATLRDGPVKKGPAADATETVTAQSLTLRARGDVLVLDRAPADATYRPDYPNPRKLQKMVVSIDEAAAISLTCAGGGADDCAGAPFFTNAEKKDTQWVIHVIDIYGREVASFATKHETVRQLRASNQAPADDGAPAGDGASGPSPAPGGGVCDQATAEQMLCNEVLATLAARNIHSSFDCEKVHRESTSFFGGGHIGGLGSQPGLCEALLPWGTLVTAFAACDVDLKMNAQNWMMQANHALLSSGACSVTPLVVDVDGDGIHLSALASGAVFDLLGDGSRVRASWPEGKDAFLALDRDGTGTIDDASELFGSATNHRVYRDGFAALSELDANQDGRVDARDPDFERLRLWADENRDGVSQPTELQSLADASITSIATHARRIQDSRAFDDHGNDVSLRASFERRDGRPGTIVDAFVRVSPERLGR